MFVMSVVRFSMRYPEDIVVLVVIILVAVKPCCQGVRIAANMIFRNTQMMGIARF